MSVADNLTAVRTRIDDACRACDRDPGEVSLLPVSKTKPPSMVEEAYEAGYRLFGENKVQDALAKSELMDADHPGLEWAVIGGLQTNKAKYVARFATEFQALDSLKVARELDKRLQKEGRQLRVLVQVNSSVEPQKSGIAPDEAVNFAKELAAFDSLDVRGLMTVALNSSEPKAVADCFDVVVGVQEKLRQEVNEVSDWSELSMGMSGDLEIAVAHGSTQVRIGTDIFGARTDPAEIWRP
ncbi:YggS family pyridoxal phosphate-dependent enzyme [Cutibacterium avidum]|uniref:Pyridoxal phosphate homeostasis protein n=1 Tax=Cutibacterium avidum ATCC 25577 TaxID=997355 RepID=G4CZW0_9ACTN|nr:YggS family pyridoxal phosphate-dependent enzyme [Cutibacterium avidum]ERS24164.1 YggS family pyridoxal phosphate enzyme [Propionibacterium sp. KPL2005]ERS26116.1 YggS family pyridoxal phosphate enzyme [Propionibacterium sp. KPL2000]ERS37184.1 YggS family pyridoxal phosphate enzyme [Propionibacterium sp. KPL1838]ERS66324.1 YggS family pyridoxal phosphate enzyme [Propionibacterium sp. KPL1852]MDU6248038.1 YggS family pyridoxal phosphate-dependent enzyme [Paeniclostridium sordellii]